jgi:Ca-activated chloride channel homolog
MTRRIHQNYANRRGAMVVLIAVTLVILLIGAMFSVDVAYMHVVRAELRTATDAAAKAGAATLARTQDSSKAISATKEYARKNAVASQGLGLANSDIELGGVLPTRNRFDFIPGKRPLTAVRVNGRRDQGSIDGTVSLFFGKAFNVHDFTPTQMATGAANVRDVALVLDISGSMAADMGRITRLRALQNAVDVFLDELARSSPLAQVSLSVYSTEAKPLLPLTSDLQAIRRTVARFQADGFTAIGLGLQTGVRSLLRDPLTRPHAAKNIIVMTDGQHNTGPSPLQTVRDAVAANHTVHTVTFSPDANRALMQSVAEATDGGQHFHANDGRDLSSVFRTIAKNLSVILID